eukprot:scaffold12490_cov99-Amphora_coffeaeformis.AAC.1
MGGGMVKEIPVPDMVEILPRRAPSGIMERGSFPPQTHGLPASYSGKRHASTWGGITYSVPQRLWVPTPYLSIPP